MSSVPRYWRATGGYQDAPTPSAPPSPPARTWRATGSYQNVSTAPAPAPAMPKQQTMSWPPWYCTQWAGQQCVRGPVPVNGVWNPYMQPMLPPLWPGAGGWNCVSPPPPYVPLATGAKKGDGETRKDEGKKEEDKEEEKEKAPENPDAPPKLDEGVNYMFDKGHTMLHIFNKAAPIWEEKYHGQELKFKMFKTPTSFTPKLIIEKVLRKEGDQCIGWAVTEAHERGDGVWSKGMSIEYTSDKAGHTLPKFGWSTKRGDSLPPVWLVVHKV